jgi:hypothetical protein
MRFSKDEIARARRLRASGLHWRPAIGDWYVTDDGFVGVLTGNGDGLEVSARHTWLPRWSNCREWLRGRGCTQPEFITDGEADVRVEMRSASGEFLSGAGATDRVCLYAIMETLLQGTR